MKNELALELKVTGKEQLDENIEKAKQLVELLREVQSIINSLNPTALD